LFPQEYVSHNSIGTHTSFNTEILQAAEEVAVEEDAFATQEINIKYLKLTLAG
jgi:hypothetical protein